MDFEAVGVRFGHFNIWKCEIGVCPLVEVAYIAATRQPVDCGAIGGFHFKVAEQLGVFCFIDFRELVDFGENHLFGGVDVEAVDVGTCVGIGGDNHGVLAGVHVDVGAHHLRLGEVPVVGCGGHFAGYLFVVLHTDGYASAVVAAHVVGPELISSLFVDVDFELDGRAGVVVAHIFAAGMVGRHLLDFYRRCQRGIFGFNPAHEILCPGHRGYPYG